MTRLDCSTSVLEGWCADMTGDVREVLGCEIMLRCDTIVEGLCVRYDSVFDRCCRLSWKDNGAPAYDEESEAE